MKFIFEPFRLRIAMREEGIYKLVEIYKIISVSDKLNPIDLTYNNKYCSGCQASIFTKIIPRHLT